jgi:CheY-like chemotaxis protein
MQSIATPSALAVSEAMKMAIFAAANCASEDPAVRDVPAAALTAYARSEDRTRALRSGFDMHLAKPIDPAELVASVSMLARRARQDR